MRLSRECCCWRQPRPPSRRLCAVAAAPRGTRPLPAAESRQHTAGTERWRHGGHVCGTAASDERSRSEPTYLSDLIAFESDAESGSGSASPASGGSASPAGGGSRSSLDLSPSSPGGGLAGSLGLASGEADPTARAQEIINRATEVLAAARAALGTPAAADGGAAAAAPEAPAQPGAAPGATSSSTSASAAPGAAQQQQQQQQPATGGGLGGSGAGASEPLMRRWSQLAEGQDLTRHVLQSALDQMQRSGAPIAAPDAGPSGGGGAAAAAGPGAAAPGGRGGARPDRDIRRGGAGGAGGAPGHGPAPGWAASLLGADDFGSSGSGYAPGRLFPSDAPPEPALQPKRAAVAMAGAPAAAVLAFADDEPPLPEPLALPPSALAFVSQADQDARRARAAVLPPLQSVVELTTAFRPPERGGAAPAAEAATAGAAEAAPVGRALADGSGRLADGTWWEKKSGVEYGPNGYWKRWQLLRGGNAEGTLEWEETWWEASDYTGLKEMGAEKKGHNTDGDAWRESWTERLMYASNDLDCVVERNAHKWAAEANGDEWEERWGEHYHAGGKVAKYADKWGKAGPNVWHERWGEDYDSSGDACVKWTDKWAERLLPGGAREQWGDKWHEAFSAGRGEKNGEVWSVGAGGDRYQRWWGEHHLGDRRVRRFGHSTTGESWDETIGMDTYYNPVPHFGFKLALAHSPQLRSVPLKPKEHDKKDPFGPGLDKL